MFDDYWRIHCRSQDSAGKRTVKTIFLKFSNSQKFLEVPIWPEDGSSQKERAR
jgi:hypothetical protein